MLRDSDKSAYARALSCAMETWELTPKQAGEERSPEIAERFARGYSLFVELHGMGENSLAEHFAAFRAAERRRALQ